MPTFTPTYRAIPVKVQVNNGEYKEFHCLSDGRGYIYSKEEVEELFEKIRNFYESEDSIKYLVDYYKGRELKEIMSQTVGIIRNENGKYIIPPANYTYKVFKTDKRHWSIKCGWCREKVSSKTEEGYYSINERYFQLYEKACSEDCTNLIWKDTFKNWLHKKGYLKFFEY